MNRPDRVARRALKRAALAVEREQLEAEMPLSMDDLIGVLEVLESDSEPCDHTNRQTRALLGELGVDVEATLAWMAGLGGYCDCEVVLNVSEIADPYREDGEPPDPTPSCSVLEPLDRSPLWRLDGVAKPWKIVRRRNEPEFLQFGKKDVCTLRFFEASISDAERANDEFWAELWGERTGLLRRAERVVVRDSLMLPRGYLSVIVTEPSWIPVLGWILPAGEQWVAEIRTEASRRRGDEREIEALVSKLEATCTE